MNILKKAFFIFVLSLITFSNSFALVLEWDINLDNATSDSLSLSWEPVDGALWYFVYYDTVSHADDKEYSNSTDDMIDGTGVTLENLSPDTDYYIALRVVDWDWNEWDFSKEFVYSTLAEENKNLYIEWVQVANKNKVLVNFNVDIDKTKDIEFKIEDKNDETKTIDINNINVEWNQVQLDLADDLEANKTYTLTVISLTGINWETINAWVDGVIDFNTWDEVELNSASETYSDEAEVNEEETETGTTDTNTWETLTGTELNSAWVDLNTWTTTLSWTNLNNEDIKKTAELAAKKTEKLPKTGPTEWLLLILALLVAFVVTRFKKA